MFASLQHDTNWLKVGLFLALAVVFMMVPEMVLANIVDYSPDATVQSDSAQFARNWWRIFAVIGGFGGLLVALASWAGAIGNGWFKYGIVIILIAIFGEKALLKLASIAGFNIPLS